MERFVVFSCLVGVSLAFAVGGGGGGRTGFGQTVSRRQEEASGPAAICQSVEQLLEQARAGITANDLAIEAAEIQAAADAYINTHGGEVPVEDVEKLINETAASFNAQSTISALFGDPLTYSADILDDSLTLLNNLCTIVDDQEDSGQSSNPALAAISMTSEAVQNLVENVVMLITYMADNADGTDDQANENPAKRWEFTGGYQHTPEGNSWNVGVSHSWRRDIDHSKRGKWKGSLKGGYSSTGGLNIGGSISYSWGRRR